MGDSLRIKLLKAIGNDAAMHAELSSLMERTQAEFCAFHTARERELAYIMVESRELSTRIPEMREKLRNAYRMFTNGLGSENEPIERIYYRRKSANVVYLVGTSKIESYFLVPVTFGSKVRGVLFFGSIRKEAFGRSDIAVFRSLADEGEEKAPLIFRVGGEREILERLLEALPSGAALISPDGRIVGSNKAFRDILGLNGDLPENVYEIGKVSCFNLHGIWEEYGILQRNVIDRELEGSCVPERYLSVSCMHLEDLSEDVASIVFLKEITSAREQAEAREEIVAMVAHELRTPLTALKNSLAILDGLGIYPEGKVNGDSPGSPEGNSDRERGIVPAARFLSNAIRTVDRLGRLVDSLIDASAARVDERPLKAEPHDVREFLEDVSTLFVEPMRKKGIDLAIRVAEESVNLTFDKDRMEQVIQNLLANSIKHVPGGGEVSISVSPCIGCPRGTIPGALLRYMPRIGFADLCIRDNGSGIPRNVAEKVNTAGGSSERPARASQGLGFIIAKRLVSLHGGSLVVQEGMEEGSAVHLYLPIDQETARLVQRLRVIEMRIDEMIARGLTPAICSITKKGALSWPEAARAWRSALFINPSRNEMAEGAAFLWPLTEDFALALMARFEPPSDVDGGLSTGWAVAPGEGANLGELLSVSLERMEGAVLAPIAKGDAE